MILLLHEDLANLFRHREFSKRFTLPDAIAVIANGFVFIFEIIPEHVFRVFRCAYRLESRFRLWRILALPFDSSFELKDRLRILSTAYYMRECAAKSNIILSIR